MRFKIIVLLCFIFVGITNPSFAVSPQKKVLEELLIESGSSTKNIMPLLTDIAEKQHDYFKHKGYFKRIYGQYRIGHIIITIYSNGKIRNNLDKLEIIGKQVFRNTITKYPHAEGNIKIVGADSEPWQWYRIEFKKGKVSDEKFYPTRAEIDEIVKLRKKGPVEKFKLSETKRKEIFKEIVRAEDKAYDESKKLHPYGQFTSKDPEFYKIAKERGKAEDKIVEREFKTLSDKYKLTREQLDEIIKEAEKKRWPLPARP